MKRLFLTSYGITNQKIADALSDLVGKPLNEIRVAVVAEAHFQKPRANKYWYIDELYRLGQYLGGWSAKIDFVSLYAIPREKIIERLSMADVIYVVGGGISILPEIFAKTGFDEIVRGFLDEKVYMGSSAGSMILTKLITEPEFMKEALMGRPEEEYLAYKNVEVVDFGFLPHLNREDKPFKNTANMKRILDRVPFPVYGVEDSQTVVVRGDEVSFVGDGEVQVFGAAK